MARLVGLIGNRSDVAGRILAAEAGALRARRDAPTSRPEGRATPPPAGPLGWGIGFWQGGEVLIRRRPSDDSEVVDVGKLGADVRGDAVICHVRNATVGDLRTENTHPFRYREWLFAQTGTVSGFASHPELRNRMLASVPDFLRAGIRGETDAEIVFHIFLSFLHDAGKLHSAANADQVSEALRASLSVIDGLSAEFGGEPAAVNVLVGNGELFVGTSRRSEMAYRIFAGREDAEQLLGDDHALRRRTPDLERLHAVLLASDFDNAEVPAGRWKRIAKRAMVTLSRDADPKVTPL
jgi:glutamine amidotransferase